MDVGSRRGFVQTFANKGEQRTRPPRSKKTISKVILLRDTPTAVMVAASKHGLTAGSSQTVASASELSCSSHSNAVGGVIRGAADAVSVCLNATASVQKDDQQSDTAP